jgi:prophage endopeptidase
MTVKPMPALNLKLWLYGGIAVVLFGLVLRFDYLSEKVESQKAELESQQRIISEKDLTLKMERESLRLATENRTKYILELESAENEIKILRARVDSGAAKLRVKATCASVPTAASNPAGSAETDPELTTDARQAYWDLRSEMTQLY